MRGIMSQQMRAVVVVACLLLLSGGCVTLPIEGDSTPDRYAELTPRPAVETGAFNYSGAISLSGVGDGCVRDIEVVMYDADENRIGSTAVGDLCYNDSAPQSKNVTLSATTQPVYIIIESPDFWDDDTVVKPSGLLRDPELDLYDEYPIEEQNQIRPRGVHQRTTANGTTVTNNLVWSAVEVRRAA